MVISGVACISVCTLSFQQSLYANLQFQCSAYYLFRIALFHYSFIPSLCSFTTSPSPYYSLISALCYCRFISCTRVRLFSELCILNRQVLIALSLYFQCKLAYTFCISLPWFSAFSFNILQVLKHPLLHPSSFLLVFNNLNEVVVGVRITFISFQ